MSGFSTVPLGQALSAIESGKSIAAEPRPAADGEYGVLKLSAVTWGSFRPGENKAFFAGHIPDPEITIRRGDLLISRANTTELVGAVAVVEEDYPRLALSDKTLRLVPNGNVDRRYLMYALRQRSVRDYIEARATGTSGSMRNISQATILGTPVPLPPLPEQKRIAAILDKADAIRRKRQEAIRLTEQLLRSAFLEMFAKYESPGSSRPFADVCEVLIDCRNKTAPYERDGIPLIRTTNFRGNRLDLADVKYVSDETNKAWSSRHQTSPGDIVYCREAPFGMAAIVPDDFYPCLGQRIMVARAHTDSVRREYLWAALNSRYVYQQSERVAVGATVKHLRVRDVEQLLVPVAPLPEQDQFRSLYHRLRSLSQSGANFSESADHVQGSLTQRAFLGRL